MMSARNSWEQSLHDRMISQLKAYLISKSKGQKVDVKTNPASSNENPVVKGIDTFYPDAIVYDSDTNTVSEIYEVETESTVNENSVAQWRLYSAGRNKFFLVVPRSKLEETKKLVSKNDIKIDGYYYY